MEVMADFRAIPGQPAMVNDDLVADDQNGW